MVQHFLNNKIFAVALILSLVGVAGYATKALTAGPSFCGNLEQSLDIEVSSLNEEMEDLLASNLAQEETLFERSEYSLESVMAKVNDGDVVREKNTEVWIQKALDAGAQEALEEFNVAVFEAIQERNTNLEQRVGEYESIVQQLVASRLEAVEGYYNDYDAALNEIYDVARIGCEEGEMEKDLQKAFNSSTKELTAVFSARESELLIKEDLKDELTAKKESIRETQNNYIKLYDSIKETLKRSI